MGMMLAMLTKVMVMMGGRVVLDVVAVVCCCCCCHCEGKKVSSFYIQQLPIHRPCGRYVNNNNNNNNNNNDNFVKAVKVFKVVKNKGGYNPA